MRRNSPRQIAPTDEKQQLAVILGAINQEKSNLEQIIKDVASTQAELQRLSDLQMGYKENTREAFDAFLEQNKKLQGVLKDVEATTIQRDSLWLECQKTFEVLQEARKQVENERTSNNKLRTELLENFDKDRHELELQLRDLKKGNEDLFDLNSALKDERSKLGTIIDKLKKEFDQQKMSVLLKEIEISKLNETIEDLTSTIKGKDLAGKLLDQQKISLNNQLLSLDKIIEQKKEQIELLDEEIEEKRIASLTVVQRVDDIKELEDRIRHLYKQAGLDIEKQK